MLYKCHDDQTARTYTKKIKAYHCEKSSNYKEDKKRGRKEQTNYKTKIIHWQQ